MKNFRTVLPVRSVWYQTGAISTALLMEDGKVKSFEWIVMFSLLIFLAATSTSWAQGQGQRPTCDQGSIGGCIGELLIEQDGMINAVELLLVDMAATGMLAMGQNHHGLAVQMSDIPLDLFDRIDSLRRQNTRAKAVNDATTDAEYDDMIAEGDKEKGKNCKDSDITFFNSLEDEGFLPAGYLSVDAGNGKNKFGNDKCDVFTAVDLDGISVMVNERTQNMCEEVCKDKKNAQGNSRKGESKGRLVEGLRDAKFSVSVARQNLSLQSAQIAALGTQLSQLQFSRGDSSLSRIDSSLVVEDRCGDGSAPGPGADLEAILALDITILVLDGVITLADIVTEVLALSKDVGDKTCKQTVGGFNASTVCVPFEVAFHIVKGLNGVVKGVKSILGDTKNIIRSSVAISKSNRDDDAEACRKEIRDNTTNLLTTAGETADALMRLEKDLALMNSLLLQNQELLLTPQGKRAGFPR